MSSGLRHCHFPPRRSFSSVNLPGDEQQRRNRSQLFQHPARLPEPSRPAHLPNNTPKCPTLSRCVHILSCVPPNAAQLLFPRRPRAGVIDSGFGRIDNSENESNSFPWKKCCLCLPRSDSVVSPNLSPHELCDACDLT